VSVSSRLGGLARVKTRATTKTRRNPKINLVAPSDSVTS
jgi:hypothetical protein